jgi:hypothetical protein
LVTRSSSPNRVVEFHDLYVKQRAFVDCTDRYTVVEAATKCGKTVACLVWLTATAMAEDAPGRNYWWVAPIFAQAKIAFRRLKLLVRHFRGLAAFNNTELSCTLRNGATIWFKSADHPDGLYGEDVHGAVMDEATRAKEEAWHALRSTLTATKGPVKIIGNVRGRKNWAYKLARRAESGAPGMAYFRLTAFDAAEAGIYDTAEIEDARRSLPEAVFNELYLCIPNEEGSNPFGLKAIGDCVTGYGCLVLGVGEPVTFGIDLAKSIDWTVIVGLDSEGRVCCFERFQSPWQETIERILDVVGSVTALVDSSGVGDPVLEALQRSGRDNFEGYKFTRQSKQQLMEGLAVAIQRQEVKFPEGPIASELRDFEYEYTRTGVRYSAPQGLHDDCVCALALAVRLLTAPPQPTRTAPTTILGVRGR